MFAALAAATIVISTTTVAAFSTDIDITMATTYITHIHTASTISVS